MHWASKLTITSTSRHRSAKDVGFWCWGTCSLQCRVLSSKSHIQESAYVQLFPVFDTPPGEEKIYLSILVIVTNLWQRFERHAPTLSSNWFLLNGLSVWLSNHALPRSGNFKNTKFMESFKYSLFGSNWSWKNVWHIHEPQELRCGITIPLFSHKPPNLCSALYNGQSFEYM